MYQRSCGFGSCKCPFFPNFFQKQLSKNYIQTNCPKIVLWVISNWWKYDFLQFWRFCFQHTEEMGFFSQIHNAKKPHNSYNSILVHSSSSQGNENQTISWHVLWEIRLFLPDWYQFINLGTCIFCHLIF